MVLTAAAALPLLVALLPNVVRGGAGALTATLFAVGWSLIVVGVVGMAAWLVTRALLRPLVDLIETMNPASASQHASERRESLDRPMPLEVRLLRSLMVGRDAARRREASERAMYVSTLIHDMKTPLLAVGRSIDLAISVEGEAHRRTWLEAASDEVRRMLGLVQDVVDAERLESGALRVNWSPVDLNDLVHRVASRVERMRDDVAVRVTGRTAMQHRGDPALLERALENVVANAVQHARSNVELEVMSGLVRVRDDGPGIPGDFESAGLSVPQRGAPSPSRRSGRRSSGLGLFIARKVVEAHGGRLVLESTGDLGTTLLLYVGAPRGSGERP